MTDLKPCPFCGCEARLFSCWGEDGFVVMCMGSDCGVRSGDIHFRKERAVEIWNRRVEE